MQFHRMLLLFVVGAIAHANILFAQNGSIPTAEDVLKALQQHRPINEVIPPVGVSALDLKKNTHKLLPEGWTMIDRTGRLEKRGGWWTFVFEPAKGDGPAKVLPNAKLEQMVRTTTHADADVIFTISGEVTVFQKENYLLFRMALRPRNVQTTGAIEPVEPDQPDSAEQEASKESSNVSIDSSVEDVLKKMKNLKPTQSLVGFQEQHLLDEQFQVATLERTMIADGTPFVRRAGRLFQQSGWWQFVPESDHPDHPELPLRLLPNKNTDLMASAWEHNSIGLVFIVSGEVTLFQGANYLLPGLAVRQIDSGNLRK